MNFNNEDQIALSMMLGFLFGAASGFLFLIFAAHVPISG